MIAGRDFLDKDLGAADGTGASDGLNDGLWCQSATDSSSEVGSWQYPNGASVSNNDGAGPVYMLHINGQVGLLRHTTLINFEGIYTCTIPDESDVNQILVVWAAGNAAYDGNNGQRKSMRRRRLNEWARVSECHLCTSVVV